MADRIYLADKETLDATRNGVDMANTALNTVKSGVTDIQSKIGTTSDTGGSATAGGLFAKINALISSIASHVAAWTSGRAARMDNLDAQVSTMQTEATAAARYSALLSRVGDAVTAAGDSKGAVKSIQRGIVAGVENLEDSFAITISPVNPAKCVVSFENRLVSGSNPVYAPAFLSLTSTTLTIRRPMCNGLTSYISAMWQIVEYY